MLVAGLASNPHPLPLAEKGASLLLAGRWSADHGREMTTDDKKRLTTFRIYVN
jgi:hypothetical protein